MIPISLLISCNIGCYVRNSDIIIGKTPISGAPTSVYDADIGLKLDIGVYTLYRAYPISEYTTI
jgi:hypothetical protein